MYQLSIRNWVFMAAIVCGLGTTLTSCKDDDLTEEEKQQKQEQEADEQYLLTSDFWHVVGQLSTAKMLPDDWQNSTFEPGIGQASEKSTTTRIVLTNAAEAAAESFENLTGADVTNLDVYEWKRDFGTLTYQRLHDGTGWAAVEVNIKQMPGLKRIIYCTPEQQGLNASVPGIPYYRFGDVIKKKNADDVWEYWVCVRPCFGDESKGDMHWMCLSNLPQANIDSYTYKDNRQWWFHKSLATNDEHIKNLSEMTFAILYPTKWMNHYINNQKECHFHDFHFSHIATHNQYFWELVQKAWNEKPRGEEKTVWELLFHRTMEQVKADGQLNFFTGSASGPNLFSWNLNMQTTSVNLHSDNEFFKPRVLAKKSHKKSCDDHSFDIREYSKNGKADKSTYFDNKDMYIYPLRYATGQQLLGSQPNPYQSMDNSNNIIDVYVFNKYYELATGPSGSITVFNDEDVKKYQIMKEDQNGVYYGQSFYRIGDVLKDTTGNYWFCIKPSGTDGDKRNFQDAYPECEPSNKSYFISLTPNKQSDTDRYRNYLPKREEAISIGMILADMCFRGPNRTTGSALKCAYEHIKKHAGVDIKKLLAIRDTLHNDNGPDSPPYKNHMPAFCTNIAYYDSKSTTNKQPLVRVIESMTGRPIIDGQFQYGNRFMETHAWSQYEVGNKDIMYLQDLTSDEKVQMYASDDPWVTLPWYTTGQTVPMGEGEKIIYPYEKPRSDRYLNIACYYFDWDKDKVDFKYSDPEYKSMYNEPIIFCHLVGIHDTGKQEFISATGRIVYKFETVSLVEPDGTNTSETREKGLLNGNESVSLLQMAKDFFTFNGTRSPHQLIGFSYK